MRERTASADEASPKCTLLWLFAELPLRGFRLGAPRVTRAAHLIELLPEFIPCPIDESSQCQLQRPRHRTLRSAALQRYQR